MNITLGYIEKSYFDKKFTHLTRKFEYPFVIEKIKNYLNEKKESQEKIVIENFSCGWSSNSKVGSKYGHDHESFYHDLTKEFDQHAEIRNSDIHQEDELQKDKRSVDVFKNFRYFDIVNSKFEDNEKPDVSLNISVIEHLKRELILKSINNLIENTREGGILIITFDVVGKIREIIESNFNVASEKYDSNLHASSNVMYLIVEKWEHKNDNREKRFSKIFYWKWI